MARGQFVAGFHLGLMIGCLMLSLAAEAHAGDYPDRTISLDSHVYESDLVVEGRLVAPMKGTSEKNANVRVTAVYRGPAKVGDTVLVVGIGDFQKPTANPISDIQLGPKDDLILFLKRVDAGKGLAPLGDERVTPVFGGWGDSELGARFVVRGNVYEFQETWPFMSSGPPRKYRPFVACVAPSWAGSLGEPVLPFRNRLHESAARAVDWHTRLDRSPVTDDIPWLIAILQQRYVARPAPDSNGIGYWPETDLVGPDAARQLVKLGDLRVMIKAIGVNPDRTINFSQAFMTPAARDFLLECLKDRTLAVQHRKSLANLVGYTGVVYGARSRRSATTRPASFEEQITPRNGSYLTRVAQTAADLCAAGDAGIADVLLAQITDKISDGRDGYRNMQIGLDLHDAANVLRVLYADRSASDETRFRIENAMYAISDHDYDSLGSSCGVILTLAKPGNAAGHLANTITVDNEYRRVRADVPMTSAFLILEPVAGGNSCIVASGINAQWDPALGISRNGEETLTLPPNFKPGRYRLHYRLMNGSKTVSEGHGFETTLPQPVVASSQQSLAWEANLLNFGWPPLPPYQPWPRSRKVGIPLAILAVPALLLLRAFVRSRRQHRRVRKGLCPQCAYDLRHSAHRCPECGRLVSAGIVRGLVRKSAAKIVLTGSVILLVATAAAWVRSYHVADCWIRTTAERTDSVYFSRGAIVVNLLTTVGRPGWAHERGDPQAFPQSTDESGDSASCSLLGIEYSSLSDMTIVPMWVLAFLSVAGGILMVATLRRPGPAK